MMRANPMNFPTDSVLIRRAEPSDAPRLEPLLDDVGFPANPDVIAERLAGLTSPQDHVLVAEPTAAAAAAAMSGDVGLAGVATLHLTPALHRPAPVGRITLLVVAKEMRGNGVGRALVEACERETSAAGGSIVEVISNLRYADAHDFYRRLGYEMTSHKFRKVLGDRA